MADLKPYGVYSVAGRGHIVVVLSTGHNIPHLPDGLLTPKAMIGCDITNPENYEIWEDAVLCWNVLDGVHEFNNPSNLYELNFDTDGHIPFDMSTGLLRGCLSLLKFAQGFKGVPQYETEIKTIDNSKD